MRHRRQGGLPKKAGGVPTPCPRTAPPHPFCNHIPHPRALSTLHTRVHAVPAGREAGDWAARQPSRHARPHAGRGAGPGSGGPGPGQGQGRSRGRGRQAGGAAAAQVRSIAAHAARAAKARTQGSFSYAACLPAVHGWYLAVVVAGFMTLHAQPRTELVKGCSTCTATSAGPNPRAPCTPTALPQPDALYGLRTLYAHPLVPSTPPPQVPRVARALPG